MHSNYGKHHILALSVKSKNKNFFFYILILLAISIILKLNKRKIDEVQHFKKIIDQISNMWMLAKAGAF